MGPVAPLVNRVDPDEYAIERGELCAHGVEDVVLVYHRLRIDTEIRERPEDGLEPLASGVARFASSPRQRIATRPRRTVDSDMENGSAFMIVLLSA
jgi:hypothetical protein